MTTLLQFIGAHPILSVILLIVLLGGTADIFSAMRGKTE